MSAVLGTTRGLLDGCFRKILAQNHNALVDLYKTKGCDKIEMEMRFIVNEVLIFCPLITVSLLLIYHGQSNSGMHISITLE